MGMVNYFNENLNIAQEKTWPSPKGFGEGHVFLIIYFHDNSLNNIGNLIYTCNRMKE
jgi:hypothetical protein